MDRADGQGLRIAAMTPLRDEEESLGRLAMCMLTQTQPPQTWHLVDTGSTDATPALARSLARDHSWVRFHQIEGPAEPTRGAPVVAAIHHVFGATREEVAELLLKVDADVSFGRDYLERLARAFEQDPLLGMASGVRSEWRRGRWRVQRSTATTVEAQARIYRAACFDELAPLHERVGWDVVDESLAAARGWRLHRLEDVVFLHHRSIGQRESAVAAWLEQGAVAHYAGYRPTYVLARAVRRAVREPAAAALLLGYGSAAVRGRPRCPDREAVLHRRRQQRARHALQRLREIRVDRHSPLAPRSAQVDVLLVSSRGGHLLDLWSLRRSLAGIGCLWVTEDQVDSRTLLDGEPVIFVPHHSRRRAPWLLAADFARGVRLVRRVRPRVVVSAGAGLSVGYCWAARVAGATVVAVECGGRSRGLSLTTRLVRPIASRVYVQWPEQVEDVPGSIYAGAAALAVPPPPGADAAGVRGAEVVVTVGTCPYPFERLVALTTETIGESRLILQRGATPHPRGGMVAFDYVSADALLLLMRGATAVVTHAGVGSVATALAAGKIPIVVPRESRRREQVDDHQIDFARRLAGLGLARLVTTPEALTTALALDQSARDVTGLPSLGKDLRAFVERAVAEAPRSRTWDSPAVLPRRPDDEAREARRRR